MIDSIEEKALNKNSIIQINNNLDIIPCTLDLAAIEMSLVNVMSREHVLKSIINEIKDDYDNIIIDCSPSLGMLTINALTASNSVIIPVTPEYLSARGLGLLANNINKIKKKINPELTIDGVLITMTNERTNLNKSMIRAIQDGTILLKQKLNLDIKVFENKIPTSIKTGEAIVNKKSIIEYDPKNKVAQSYERFAKEWEVK
jgi:chromosome partitioning protein